MTIACLELKLTPAEALAAVTINAAHALGLGDEIGSIEPASRPTWRSGGSPATARSRTGRRRPWSGP